MRCFSPFRWQQMCFSVVLLVLVFILGACTPSYRRPVHNMAEPSEGVIISCQRCYDHAVRVLTGPPKHRRYKTEERHACPDCASEAVIYEGPEGEVMIRCSGCAPDGVRCTKCLPPNANRS